MIKFIPEEFINNGVFKDAHYVSSCGGSLIVWEGHHRNLTDLLPELRRAGFDPIDLQQWMEQNRIEVSISTLREMHRQLSYNPHPG